MSEHFCEQVKGRDRIIGNVRTQINYEAKKGVKERSDWMKLLESMTETNFQEVVSKFAEQMKVDMDNLNKGLPVSECAIVCPTKSTHYDRKFGFAYAISNILFPLSEADKNKPQEVIHRWFSIQYQQCLTRLRKAYKDQITKKVEEEHIYQIQRISNRRNFCTLKDKKISDRITDPTPMPVEVAPLDDLVPFFEHMKKNIVCEPNNDKDYVQFKRGAYYTDGRIDMCKQVVGEPWIAHLTGSIKNNPHVKHFLLGNNIVDATGAKAIADFIKDQNNNHNNNNLCHIRTWYIAGNKIDAKGVQLIAEALETDVYAEALWLKRNPLMPEGIKYISNMLKLNSSLQILDLHNVAILDEGCEYLFDSLKHNRTLDILYLGANGITPAGCAKCANYYDHIVRNNVKGVRSLFIDMNRLDDEGAILIATSIGKYKDMERLALSSNRIGDAGAKVIFETFVDHPSLFMLDLGFYKSTSDMKELPNNISDSSIPDITNFIKKNKKISVFSIANNNISADGIIMIAESLQDNDNIVMFYYEQYGVDVPSNTRKMIKNRVTENIMKNWNMSAEDFSKTKARILKHGDKINRIDSIYRNNI